MRRPEFRRASIGGAGHDQIDVGWVHGLLEPSQHQASKDQAPSRSGPVLVSVDRLAERTTAILQPDRVHAGELATSGVSTEAVAAALSWLKRLIAGPARVEVRPGECSVRAGHTLLDRSCESVSAAHATRESWNVLVERRGGLLHRRYRTSRVSCCCRLVASLSRSGSTRSSTTSSTVPTSIAPRFAT